MDAAGIDVQVLSRTQPGTEMLAPDVAIPLSRETNDLLAAAIGRHPDRFSGLIVPSRAGASHFQRLVSYSLSGEEGGPRTEHKPGSVPALAGGDHLSGTPVSRRL
jgi:predicted TIM-barrel fold metal-dependent hydrolase